MVHRQIKELEQAIAAQENMRSTLGDAIVDTTIAALRKQLADLETQRELSKQQHSLMTVLLADISAFMAKFEAAGIPAIEPETPALWQRLEAIVAEHGGVVNQRTPDTMMALWGVDGALKNDPERAIRAALGMQAAWAEFVQALGFAPPDFDSVKDGSASPIHIGISTGLVYLGDTDTGESSVVGEAVEMARRLAHCDNHFGIMISDATYCPVRGAFIVTPKEALVLRGRRKPIQTYAVLSDERPRIFYMAMPGVAGIETAMVGRNAELTALQDAYRDLSEDREARLFTIVGDEGLGKTRLRREFGNWIELLPEFIWNLECRATRETQLIPYRLIRDSLRRRFLICENDSPAIAVEKFRSGANAEGVEPEKADVLGHFFGFDFSASKAVQKLLGCPSFGPQAFDYLVGFLQAVLKKMPVTVYIENIHWADDSSLKAIQRLVSTLSNERLMCTGFAHPSFFKRCPDWGKNGVPHARIDLKPLSKRASRMLFADILQKIDDVSVDLRDLVVDGTEGNPYYLEEMVRMLIEAGVIIRRLDRWRVEMAPLPDWPLLSAPEEALRARLDGLPQEEAEVLQCASVVGQRFWDAAVAALLGRDDVSALLDALQERELIFRREQPAFAGTEEYTFNHGILRNRVYNSAPPDRLRAWHDRMAQWLEACVRERVNEQLSLIAWHYERADQALKALDYLSRAGEVRLAIGDFESALGLFEQALVLLPEDDDANRAKLLGHLKETQEQVARYSQTNGYP